MDSKTCESVLSELLKITKEPNISVTVPHEDLEQIFGLPENDVKAALSSLSQIGVITARFSPRHIVICVLPAAFGYFQAKRESSQLKRREKWENRAYGFISGIITTIVARFITQELLK